MEPTTDPKQREAQVFAADIARYIERGRHQGDFEALVLIAPPRFLGRLRAELTRPARDTLAGELDKNLVEADTTTIEHQVSVLLR